MFSQAPYRSVTKAIMLNYGMQNANTSGDGVGARENMPLCVVIKLNPIRLTELLVLFFVRCRWFARWINNCRGDGEVAASRAGAGNIG